MGIQEKIIEQAKAKNIKLHEEEITVKAYPLGKGKNLPEIDKKIKVMLPDKPDAESLYKAVRSADAARGLLLAKLRTDQADEIRREINAEFERKIKDAPAEQREQAFRMLGLID